MYLQYISEPVLSYFYLSKGVESVLLLLPESFFYTGICTSTSVKNVNTFATSAHQRVLAHCVTVETQMAAE